MNLNIIFLQAIFKMKTDVSNMVFKWKSLIFQIQAHCNNISDLILEIKMEENKEKNKHNFDFEQKCICFTNI